jgi:Ca2+-dependent lipid-binding protein
MMDVPFISRFISEAINAAAREYIAPKSMILDLQQLLSGDGLKRGISIHSFHGTIRTHSILTDTDHIGVVVVHIHKLKLDKNATESLSDRESTSSASVK